MHSPQAELYSSRVVAKTWQRSGFSFTEILFAIMILGIGFIMIAAIFPVAIKQTQASMEDTAAAHLAGAAADAMQKLAINANLPTNFYTADAAPPVGTPLPAQLAYRSIAGRIFTFHDARFAGDPTAFPPQVIPIADQMWEAAAGNAIMPADPRYGCVAMYRRDMVLNPNINPGGGTVTKASYSPASYAQIILIAVQARNHSQYNLARDLQRFPTNPEATLEPHLMRATTITGPTIGQQVAPGLIRFNYSGSFYQDENRVSEGMFVVISDDGTGLSEASASRNGYILKLGNRRPELANNQFPVPWFELVPGYDLPPNVVLSNAQVLVIGRGLTNPSLPAQGFDGPIQDIAAYKTFVRVQ